MPERDPVEFLSHAIDRPEQPDAAFAGNLLDQLLGDLAEATTTDAVPLPSTSIDDNTREEDFGDPPSVSVLEPVGDQARLTQVLRRRAGILTAAAVALLILGSVALLGRGSDTDSPLLVASGEGVPAMTAEVDQQPQPVATAAPVSPAQQVAVDFLTARSNHDGAAMRQLLADDATIANDYGIVMVDDYLLRSEFERLTNTEIFDVACQPVSSSERVSCLFSFRNDIARHLRTPPYDAEVIATVRDGHIVDLLAATNGFQFEDDVEYFLDWLGRTHPEEAAAVSGEPAQGSSIELQVTPESGAIFAARVSEFAATTLPPIMKLLADDPRFTIFADALERTRLGDELSFCTDYSATLFAPTNTALERYIAASGLDSDTVLADTTLFENFVVAEVVMIADAEGLGDPGVQFDTRSGVTITVIAGDQPRVQGVPILVDATDIAACNGAIHGIDEIFVLND